GGIMSASDSPDSARNRTQTIPETIPPLSRDEKAAFGRLFRSHEPRGLLRAGVIERRHRHRWDSEADSRLWRFNSWTRRSKPNPAILPPSVVPVTTRPAW